MFVQDRACCLKRTASGENRFRLHLFLREQGLFHVLARFSRKSGPGKDLPDYLAVGEVTLRRKGPEQPAWLQEFSPEAGFPGLGGDYRRLQAASRLAAFFSANLPHMEEFASAWDLLHSALGAMETAAVPEVVPLKTVFLFARAEGYPMHQSWLEGQPVSRRKALAEALRRPVAECSADARDLLQWQEDLFRFLAAETPLLPGA